MIDRAILKDGYVDFVYKALNCKVAPGSMDDHERACLQAYLESFLRCGGQFTFSEWSSMHETTQDALEAASDEVTRERAAMVQDIQIEAIETAAEEARASQALEQTAEEVLRR